MVFQRFNLVPGMSAFQNVLFGAMGQHGLWRTTTLLATTALRQEAMACLARVCRLPTRAPHRIASELLLPK